MHVVPLQPVPRLWTVSHTLLQPAQLLVVLVGVSQPSVCLLLLQSAQPEAQPPLQMPPEQVSAVVQSLPFRFVPSQSSPESSAPLPQVELVQEDVSNLQVDGLHLSVPPAKPWVWQVFELRFLPSQSSPESMVPLPQVAVLVQLLLSRVQSDLQASVPPPAEQDLAQLKNQFLKQVINDQTASPDWLLDVSVLPLATTGALSPLYAAYSTGSILSLLPHGRHVLALGRREVEPANRLLPLVAFRKFNESETPRFTSLTV